MKMNKNHKNRKFLICNFLEKNRRGEDKILAIYWFAILVLVAGGIFAMTISFYNHPYDVREIEAEIMINNIADCLSQKGELNSELFNATAFSEDFKNNFLTKCHLNFEAGENEEGQYYSEISFYKGGNLNLFSYEIAGGNKNLAASCKIQDEKEYKREATCVEKTFFALNGENLYLIKILSAIGKAEKNVR